MRTFIEIVLGISLGLILWIWVVRPILEFIFNLCVYANEESKKIHRLF